MTRTRSTAIIQPSVVIDTLGCKLNIADSDLLASDFLAAGFVLGAPGQPADVYVLNTCTVTGEADAKARQQLRRARRQHADALIIATGCYPARDAAEVAALGLADLVVDNAGKVGLAEQVRQRLRVELPVLPEYRAPFPYARTRAFVKVQEGCNDYCSYCIIPRTRGGSRFFSVHEVVRTVAGREQEGHAEVVLTGTQIGDYGIAFPERRLRAADPRDQTTEGEPLAALLQAVLAGTSVPRLRLSSLQPQDLTSALLRLWAEDPRLCPHFHVPLQSGADPVLARMRRRYVVADFQAALERIRRFVPHAGVTTDLIVGFPGERDADFEASLEVCREAGFSDIHVFPYSERPRTLAARHAADPTLAVLQPVKAERASRARTLAAALRTQALQAAVGQRRPVLWEQRTEGEAGPCWSGFTDTYLRVTAPAPEATRGTIAAVLLEEAAPDHLIGRVVG